MDDIEEIRERLKSYNRDQIDFNEPHFTQQMQLREGTKREVISNLLHPERLVYVFSERKGKDIVHNLHFKISNTRTMRLPVMFDKAGRKNLYILTYIMRHRAWQNMIRE